VKDFDPNAYLMEAAAAIDLAIPPESRAAVAANLLRLSSLADSILAFDIAARSNPADPAVE
jgi:hypothetical protein